ncbi:MAG: glycosyltransferase family 61 protein [Thermomicrobiales bacterium]
MSFNDQSTMFAEASVVAGVFGAGLTNAVFMQPEAALLEPAPPTDIDPGAHNLIFPTLAGMGGLLYGLAIGTDYDPATQDFTMPIERVESLPDAPQVTKV